MSDRKRKRGFALLKALDFSVPGYEEPLIPSDQSSYREESDDYEDNIESAIDFHQESSLLSESSAETCSSLRESEEIFDELSFEERMLSICTKHSISIRAAKELFDLFNTYNSSNILPKSLKTLTTRYHSFNFKYLLRCDCAGQELKDF